MTLVERFIEFNGWPTSRKTVLLSGIVLPFHLLAMLSVHFVLPHAAMLDIALLDQTLAGGAIALVVVLVTSLMAVRAGKEARWTAYLLTLLYGGFVFYVIQQTGSWSAPVFALYPMSVLVVTVFFGERVGWFGFWYGLVTLIVSYALGSIGVLPYAPALISRSVDAQQNIYWVLGYVLLTVMNPFLVVLMLSSLSIKAQKLQEVRLQQAQKLIRRYVPSQVADSILSGQQAAVEKHERRKLTIFFSDIVGFTDISEEMEPEDLSRVLNEYFSEMTHIARKFGGTVDELAGDAVLILFGAPIATDDKDHALRAVRMASEMQEAVQALNEKWKVAGIDVLLKVRMGLNTGVVTIGNFGSQDRMKYTALGKHVNIAARLQSHCEPGRVLLSHATWLLVQDQIPCTPKGELTLKGIVKPVMAYEVAA